MKLHTIISIFSVFLFMSITIGALANDKEEEEIENFLDFGLGVAQTSYSDSWTGGEAGTFTWVATGAGVITSELSPMITLRNTIVLAFGQTATQDKETKEWSKPEKSTDKIDLEALALFDLHTFIEPYAAFRFESQFLDASVATNERYINPIQLTESGGIARQLIKNDTKNIITRLGLALKQNINRDMIDPVTQEKETESLNDGGIESVTDIKLAVNDNLRYIGKLSLYKALFFSDKEQFEGTEEEDYWKAIDVNFENTVTASISKFIQVSLYFQILYDKQVDLRGRFKETLSLGVTYKVF